MLYITQTCTPTNCFRSVKLSSVHFVWFRMCHYAETAYLLNELDANSSCARVVVCNSRSKISSYRSMDHIDCVVVVVAVAFSVFTFVALTVSHSGSSDLRIGRLPTNVTALPSKIKCYK